MRGESGLIPDGIAADAAALEKPLAPYGRGCMRSQITGFMSGDLWP